MNRFHLFIAPGILALNCSIQALEFPSTPPVGPQNAAKTFHVLDGFEMQLIAAEPLVTDPVAITYDADGRAYVCEMNDYPYTDKAAHKPSQENPTDAHISKVRLLTDTDGDGTFDKATVFAEGLSWPTGAACWKGGIFVTATPDVWYLKDTNDDGVADVRQKVFTGFKKLNVQAVMNNPIWGLDHRIYIAGGSNGGEIQRVPGSESVMPIPKDFKSLPIKRNDFSFDPSTGDVRLESGGARFGQTFDDWGNRFLCNIRNPCQHVVLPYRYLARNPYLVVPSALNDCAEAGDQLPVWRTSPPEPWREFRAKRWVQEGSHLPKSELVGAGVVTSSSGITVYRGDAYPKEYRDFAFVADVAGNLFYRMKLVPDGVTFKALQVDGNANFCTSDDLWFRPVNFVNAPDGCLHVCDMYREVIEHPWSIPDDIHAAVDLLRGKDKGRIWRLAPKDVIQSFSSKERRDGLKPRTTLLSHASTTDLVDLLDHPNAWHRETAQRLLFERQDQAAVEPLRELVRSGKTAQGRIGALWSLGGCGEIEGAQILDALSENDSEAQGNAAAFLEHVLPAFLHVQESPWLTKGSSTDPNAYKLLKQIFEKIRLLSESSDPTTRFQSNLSVGSYAGGLGVLWKPLPQDLSDPWISKSVLMGSREFATESISRAYEADDNDIVADFAFNASMISIPAIWDSAPYIIRTLVLEAQDHWESHPAIASSVLLGLNQSTRRLGTSIAEQLQSRDLDRMDEIKMIRQWIAALPNQIAQDLIVERSDTGKRIRLMKLMTLADFQTGEATLKEFFTPSTPAELQLAALEALGSYREPAVADMLIDAWPKLTPSLRDKATTILLARTDRIAKLLDAIEAKKITPAQISVAAKATLGRQKTPALAERIAKLIGDGSSSNRKEVIAKYLTAMLGSDAGTPARNETVVAGKSARITGDAARGAKIYETACMVCHKFADKGNDVGPHLGTIKAWTAEQLVTNILDPNREVSPNFALYIVETNDGRTLSGLIASETAGNLTLKRADGGTDTVLRSEIKTLTSPGISLMPEGLEAAISPQQMADLIAWLRAD